MFRILFSVAVAAAAFFGPWFAETAGAGEAVRSGDYYAGGTVACLMEARFSVSGPCAPAHGLAGLLVTAAVVLGAASAAVNILGVLPVIRRAASLFAVAAGVAGMAGFAAVALGVADAPGLAVADLRWGAFAVGGFGLLCMVSGFQGVGGDRRG